MKRVLVSVIAGLLLAAMGVEAAGLSLVQKMELRRACQADFRATCGDRKPGDGQPAQCRRDNVSTLSEPCRKAIEAVRGDVLEGRDEAMDY